MSFFAFLFLLFLKSVLSNTGMECKVGDLCFGPTGTGDGLECGCYGSALLDCLGYSIQSVNWCDYGCKTDPVECYGVCEAGRYCNSDECCSNDEIVRCHPTQYEVLYSETCEFGCVNDVCFHDSCHVGAWCPVGQANGPFCCSSGDVEYEAVCDTGVVVTVTECTETGVCNAGLGVCATTDCLPTGRCPGVADDDWYCCNGGTMAQCSGGFIVDGTQSQCPFGCDNTQSAELEMCFGDCEVGADCFAPDGDFCCTDGDTVATCKGGNIDNVASQGCPIGCFDGACLARCDYMSACDAGYSGDDIPFCCIPVETDATNKEMQICTDDIVQHSSLSQNCNYGCLVDSLGGDRCYDYWEEGRACDGGTWTDQCSYKFFGKLETCVAGRVVFVDCVAGLGCSHDGSSGVCNTSPCDNYAPCAQDGVFCCDGMTTAQCEWNIWQYESPRFTVRYNSQTDCQNECQNDACFDDPLGECDVGQVCPGSDTDGVACCNGALVMCAAGLIVLDSSYPQMCQYGCSVQDGGPDVCFGECEVGATCTSDMCCVGDFYADCDVSGSWTISSVTFCPNGCTNDQCIDHACDVGATCPTASPAAYCCEDRYDSLQLCDSNQIQYDPMGGQNCLNRGCKFDDVTYPNRCYNAGEIGGFCNNGDKCDDGWAVVCVGDAVDSSEFCQWGCNNGDKQCYGECEVGAICGASTGVCCTDTVFDCVGGVVQSSHEACTGLCVQEAAGGRCYGDCEIGNSFTGTDGWHCCSGNRVQIASNIIVGEEACDIYGCGNGQCLGQCEVGASQCAADFCCSGTDDLVLCELGFVIDSDDCSQYGCDPAGCLDVCDLGAKCSNDICCAGDSVFCDTGFLSDTVTDCSGYGCQNGLCLGQCEVGASQCAADFCCSGTDDLVLCELGFVIDTDDCSQYGCDPAGCLDVCDTGAKCQDDVCCAGDSVFCDSGFLSDTVADCSGYGCQNGDCYGRCEEGAAQCGADFCCSGTDDLIKCDSGFVDTVEDCSQYGCDPAGCLDVCDTGAKCQNDVCCAGDSVFCDTGFLSDTITACNSFGCLDGVCLEQCDEGAAQCAADFCCPGTDDLVICAASFVDSIEDCSEFGCDPAGCLTECDLGAKCQDDVCCSGNLLSCDTGALTDQISVDCGGYGCADGACLGQCDEGAAQCAADFCCPGTDDLVVCSSGFVDSLTPCPNGCANGECNIIVIDDDNDDDNDNNDNDNDDNDSSAVGSNVQAGTIATTIVAAVAVIGILLVCLLISWAIIIVLLRRRKREKEEEDVELEITVDDNNEEEQLEGGKDEDGGSGLDDDDEKKEQEVDEEAKINLLE